MTAISITAESRRARTGRRSKGDPVTRLNSITFWIVLAILALAPVPFGSARGLYWALLAVIIGLLAIAYCVTMVWVGQPLRTSTDRFRLQAAIWMITCLWLVVQIVPPIGMPIVLPDGTALDSATISVAPGMTVLMLARQLAYGLFFFLVLQIAANDKRRKLLLDLLLCIIIAHGLYGMISLQSGDTILGMEKWAYNGYATGTFVNRNSYATFLAMGSIIAMGRLGALVSNAIEKHKDDGRPRNFASSLLILSIGYLFLVIVVLSSASRMGIFVTAAGSLVALTVLLRGLSGKRALLTWLPVLLLGIAAALILFGPGLIERIGGVQYSAEVRGDFYQQIWQLILMRPWTGYGGGSFEMAFPLVHAAPVDSDKIWNLAHNTYLGLWTELGLIVGSLVILSVTMLTYQLVMAIIQRRGSLETQAIALGAIVACALHSLVDFSLEIPANTLVFLAIMAAGMASIVSNRRKDN